MMIFAKLILEKGTLSDLYEECDFSFVVMFCLLYYEVSVIDRELVMK